MTMHMQMDMHCSRQSSAMMRNRQSERSGHGTARKNRFFSSLSSLLPVIVSSLPVVLLLSLSVIILAVIL